MVIALYVNSLRGAYILDIDNHGTLNLPKWLGSEEKRKGF